MVLYTLIFFFHENNYFILGSEPQRQSENTDSKQTKASPGLTNMTNYSIAGTNFVGNSTYLSPDLLAQNRNNNQFGIVPNFQPATPKNLMESSLFSQNYMQGSSAVNPAYQMQQMHQASNSKIKSFSPRGEDKIEILKQNHAFTPMTGQTDRQLYLTPSNIVNQSTSSTSQVIFHEHSSYYY